MLPHIDKLDKKFMNAMKNSETLDTLVTNKNLNSGTEKDSNSTLYFLLMPNHTGKLATSEMDEGLEGWRLSDLESDLQARLTADGSMRELQGNRLPERHRGLRAVRQRILETRAGYIHRPKGPALIRGGGVAPAGRRKAAIHHHVCDQVGSVRRRPRRDSQIGQGRCSAQADWCSERQMRQRRTVLVPEGQTLGGRHTPRGFRWKVSTKTSSLRGQL